VPRIGYYNKNNLVTYSDQHLTIDLSPSHKERGAALAHDARTAHSSYLFTDGP